MHTQDGNHRIAASCLALFVIVGLGAAASAASGPGSDERRVSFNEGWRFLRGDTAGAEKTGFDDAAWRVLDLPHDWAIEGPFDPKYNPHCGGLPYYGVGWYRKRFTVPAESEDRYHSIEFDGAMSNARVFLNGEELGGRPYGYIGFAFDMTPYLRFGGENVVAVRLAPEPESSRWYPGAGIYRNVWLDVTGPVHVARWGTYITTPAVTDAQATVTVRTELRNRGPKPAHVTLEAVILDSEGKEAGRTTVERTVPAGGTDTGTGEATVERPQRWDIERPYLYRLVSVVRDGTHVLDRHVTPFGIRSIEFDKAKGFLLNGRRVRFQGVCDHHDLGALGAAVNRRAIERQLEILKRMGANALRTSHNPPAPELLEAADRLGLLVMDEAFDMWHIPKVKNGLSKFFDQWGETDLRDMIRRDRNHPSVVLWSIGNEIPEQDVSDGWKLAKRLTAVCHEEDPTRPVTAALNSAENAIKNRLADQVDIPGFNYRARDYKKILADHPGWTILASETASCVSSRGVYHLPIEKYEKHPSLQLTSYDVIAPPWAYCPDVEFAALEASPAVLGEFVWTGFDYLGEPTPYVNDEAAKKTDWPARSSYFGIVDLAGFPKDRYYLYQSVWTSEPMVHILPHWNWAGREGQSIPVMAYTNADQVELFLDGRSLGRKQRGAEAVTLPVGKKVSDSLTFVSRYRMLWQVPYEPGTLRAVAYKAGRAVATAEVRTAGPPARLALSPDRTTLRADGEDLSFVTVRVEDKDGNLCPAAENLIRFAVEGAGRLAAVDNGNAATVEPFQADHRKVFSGMALLIVRSKSGGAGPIRITASSDGLQSAETAVSARVE
jgi:beta-galactosidase